MFYIKRGDTIMKKFIAKSVLCLGSLFLCTESFCDNETSKYDVYTFEMRQDNDGPAKVKTENYGIKPDGSRYHQKKQGYLDRDGNFREEPFDNEKDLKVIDFRKANAVDFEEEWQRPLAARSRIPTWRNFWKKFVDEDKREAPKIINLAEHKDNINDRAEIEHPKDETYNLQQLKNALAKLTPEERAYVLSQFNAVDEDGNQRRCAPPHQRRHFFPRHQDMRIRHHRGFPRMADHPRAHYEMMNKNDFITRDGREDFEKVEHENPRSYRLFSPFDEI